MPICCALTCHTQPLVMYNPPAVHPSARHTSNSMPLPGLVVLTHLSSSDADMVFPDELVS